MRIGIDASPLFGGHAGRGTGTYTRELVAALKKYSGSEVIELQKNFQLPQNIDLVHYPYFDPFFLTLPIIKKKPTVVTVHDLIPLVYPDHFPPGVRGTIKWHIQKFSLQGATAIVTDSEASKRDIVRIAGIASEKIFVVYLAPSSMFVPQSKKEQQRVQKKYQLSDRFVLYVGDVNWNKNIPRLIEAMQGISEELILVGKAFLDTQLPEVGEIDRAIDKLGVSGKVRKLGFIPDTDLPALYSAASVYVQPSLAEGFGLPVLEAMACGTPAVVSSTTSLREIAGPSLLIDPERVHSIQKGIIDALKLEKKDIVIELSSWVEKFSWKNVAQETMNIYKKLI